MTDITTAALIDCNCDRDCDCDVAVEDAPAETKPVDPVAAALQPTLARLDALHQLEDNWDGFGSVKPDSVAILLAKRLMPSLYRAAEHMGGWMAPHVAADEDGLVMLEWWRGARTLTLFIAYDHIAFLRAWGVDMHTEMDDGELSPERFLAIWQWFIDKEAR